MVARVPEVVTRKGTRSLAVATALTLASVMMVPPSGAADARSRALSVPGLSSLNTGGKATVNGIDCSSPGNCSAGGYYTRTPAEPQAFVVSETGGRWHLARTVRVRTASGFSDSTQINAISCSSAGNCSAGGGYLGASSNTLAFVVNEVNGSWQAPVEVRGVSLSGTGQVAFISSVSCRAAGQCSAGGTYTKQSGGTSAFVVDEVNGQWQRAAQVPGLSSLNVFNFATINSMSCGAPGYCSAGGFYDGASGTARAFIANEVAGRWHRAITLRGFVTQQGGAVNSVVNAVSCPSLGTCSAGGYYSASPTRIQGFVVEEVDDVWGSASDVPSLYTLNVGRNARITSLSCSSAGNCTAGGYYTNITFSTRAFLSDEVNGTWRGAFQVPGTASSNPDVKTMITSLSCSAKGSCTAGGTTSSGPASSRLFMVSEAGGTWHRAIDVAGGMSSRSDGSQFESLSCSAPGDCGAGGAVADAPSNAQAFVFSTGDSSTSQTITCVKGKASEQVAGKNPRCPSGYTRS
jgi:hypothetical protein